MLNCTLNQREIRYRNLNNFTKEVHKEITELTSALGWTMESIEIDNDNHLICPYDSSHRIGKENLDQHLELCQWKEDGYSEFDVPLSEPNLSLCSPFSIKLDVYLQNNILQEAKRKDPTIRIGLGERLIPRTCDRIFADFTPDERKILHKYIVSHTSNMNDGHNFADTGKLQCQDKEDKKLSFLELLVQERNLKRRRAKHRGVHTNKKSHTEILREIINQEMELYIDHISGTRQTDHDAKVVDLLEAQTSKKRLDNVMQNTSSAFNDCNLFLRESKDYHGSSSFRKDRIETTHASSLKNQESRDKNSQTTTEPWKVRKERKHKRSHSRERDYNKKRKQHYHREACMSTEAQYDETEKFYR
ncbi:PREDICTED: U11/U12 small nuclear ribonucleoprotein 48 kDa protein-like [Dufourea novaeangliae]|uniref:U11/U12 small nuclear ribonucleoprotein 48 kDa protein n=1 Tax=Dufourea novaeangliae TaxID=178035 RepID=A0A154PF14_DUFNO|nr:PREDICTED: U11/U12 small nuclear ribonucleoprotein 48 kDa protein-like [Dufourea novaeangliae]KZC10449.1 U11/U12 small nuclear ribonucleoprotein 48 kDa protein [Dufourea novaeangliae]